MKSLTAKKKGQLVRRHARIRSRIKGTAERPRLAVFRSNKCIYAQIIDDTAQVTLVAASDIKELGKGTKSERAVRVGTHIAKLAQEKNITTVVFDRGGFAYTGRVQALADAARAGGLTF